MKAQYLSASIAAVALMSATSVSAQVHHNNMHPAGVHSFAGAQHTMNNGNVGYAPMHNGNGSANFYYRHLPGTISGAAAGQPFVANNQQTVTPRVSQHHFAPEVTTGSIPNSTGLPLGTTNQSALATVRQEVRADKMAVRTDMATGNNTRLRQDEARLQTDERLERQLRGQGKSAWNNRGNSYFQNNVPFVQNAAGFNSLSQREFRHQNYAALHANYKNRNASTNVAKVQPRNTD